VLRTEMAQFSALPLARAPTSLRVYAAYQTQLPLKAPGRSSTHTLAHCHLGTVW
jgi:hypothetical protein